ncbi:hypothetical protein [Amycolatopsis nigrescens]|uniref:hypothetical protein n=1 Tax=Amycolatopsis nigrescens TaxID=381445 RepID=UPI000373BE3B|nr:hypothetical protein [Amycolatopsis nigrescens]
MVRMKLVEAWHAAFDEYETVSKQAACSREVDAETARNLAVACSAVASAWREIDSEELPARWSSVALTMVADRFEQDAAHWDGVAQQRERETATGGAA